MDNKNVTKKNIADKISLETGLSQKEVKIVIQSFLEEIVHNLEENKHVELRTFGSFKLKSMKERMARNPKTGQEVLIPSYKRPFLKFSRSVIDKLN